MSSNRINLGQPSRANLHDKRAKKTWVWRLAAGESGTLLILSPDLWGFNVHWDARARRSRPHFTDKGTCPGCLDELPSKPIFYLLCWHCEKSRQVFLELPEGAAMKLEGLLGMGEKFRGLTVHVERTRAKNGRINFRPINGAKAPEKMAPDKDPWPTLMDMWGLKPDDPRGGLAFPTNGKAEFSENGHE